MRLNVALGRLVGPRRVGRRRDGLGADSTFAAAVATAPRRTRHGVHADPTCRGVPDCGVRVGVPPAIARLARAYLPPGVQLRVRTVVAAGSLIQGNLLVARDIDAHVDSITVLIRVRGGGSDTQAIAPDPLGVDSLLLHRVNSGFVVRVQYLAPDSIAPMVDRLRPLIRDPRLTSI